MNDRFKPSGLAPTPSGVKTVFGNAPTDGRRHGTEIDVTFGLVSGRFKSKSPQTEEVKK